MCGVYICTRAVCVRVCPYVLTYVYRIANTSYITRKLNSPTLFVNETESREDARIRAQKGRGPRPRSCIHIRSVCSGIKIQLNASLKWAANMFGCVDGEMNLMDNGWPHAVNSGYDTFDESVRVVRDEFIQTESGIIRIILK